MDAYSVDSFLTRNAGLIPNDRIMQVREFLLSADADTWEAVQRVRLPKPKRAMLLALIFGWCGAEQFYNGRPIVGIIKALLCGGTFIWWGISVMLIQRQVQKKNFKRIMEAV